MAASSSTIANRRPSTPTRSWRRPANTATKSAPPSKSKLVDAAAAALAQRLQHSHRVIRRLQGRDRRDGDPRNDLRDVVVYLVRFVPRRAGRRRYVNRKRVVPRTRAFADHMQDRAASRQVAEERFAQ